MTHKLTVFAVLFLLGVCVILPIFSVKGAPEPPAIEWQQFFVGTLGYSVVQSEDGGFTVAGVNGSQNVLIKTNSAGNLLWAKNYELGNETSFPYLIKTQDRGYALGGTLNNNYVMIKFDSEGNMQWKRTYLHDAELNSFRSLIQTGDGGYAFVGTFSRPQNVSHAMGEIWLVKTDALGRIQWSKTIVGTQGEFENSILQHDDGGYLLFGTSWASNTLPSTFKIMKTDRDGNEEWNKTFRGFGKFFHAESCAGIITKDGGYLLAGVSVEKDRDWIAWLVKTDSQGKMVWNQNYGGIGSWALVAIQSKDIGFAFAGLYNGKEVWLVKTDVNGAMEWNRTFTGASIWGGSIEDFGKCLIQAKDGGYVLTGVKNSQIWLAKTVPEKSLNNLFLDDALIVMATIIAVVAVVIVLLKQKRRLHRKEA
jgi:hypothetical protein